MRKTAPASAFFLVALCAAIPAPARAAASDWAQAEGVSLRLLTAGPPDAAGRLRGALVIELEPGWKTYWRDPGAAGVPPSLDASGSPGVASAALDFPLPARHDDGYGAWAGYDAPVTLPVTFTLANGEAPGAISAAVFLGVCRDICIPVSATLSLDTGAGDDAEDVAEVDAAFAALPAPAEAGFGIAAAKREGDTLVLDAHLPADAKGPPVLFLAGAEGWSFGVPVPSGDGQRFSVPILDAPAEAAEILYTLASGDRVVSGAFRLP